MQRTALSLEVGDGVDLVLREVWTIEPLHRLILDNLDRLRAWEPWAQEEQTLESFDAYTRAQMLQWVEDRAVPLAVRVEGELIGTVGAAIDRYTDTASVGYWVDAGHEGRGLVSRSVDRLLGMLFDDRSVARVEIRTSTANQRSRVVAERLGFTHEGTLRGALPVGGRRHDVAVYGLLAAEWAARRP